MEFPRAGSRHDRPLGGIPQRSAECCDLSGNLHRTRHYLKSRMGIDLAKEPIERDIASGIGFAKQNRDLKQGDGADRNGLMPANSIPQNARFAHAKAFGAPQATERLYACREESADSAPCRSAPAENFPKARRMGFGKIVGDRHLPFPHAFGRLPGGPLHRSCAGQRPAALCDRNRPAALPDPIQQREALRLKLGYAHNLMLHNFRIAGPKMVI